MIREEEVYAEDGVLEEKETWTLEPGEGEKESEEKDMRTADYVHQGSRNDAKERLVAVDDVPVSRPAPKVLRESVMRRGLKFFCQTCSRAGSPVVMHEALDFDEESGIMKLKCNHFRNAVIRTVGA